MHTYDRGTNEFYGDEDEVEMSAAEEQHAQEQAHEHFVAVEFSELLLNSGPTYMLNKLTKDAKEELFMAINEIQGAK